MPSACFFFRYKNNKLNNSPDAVEDGAVGEDAHVDVGHDNVVKMALAFIREEQIGHPNFARVRKSQVFNFAFNQMMKAPVPIEI